MSTVCLRAITKPLFHECIKLAVDPSQEAFVAPNVYSLAQAKVNPLLMPWAIYDGSILARDITADDTMVGFCMVQEMDGVGFIMRLMIDHRFQRRGYGRATMEQVIERLRRTPGIEIIATSVHRDNAAAEALYRSLCFVDNPMMDDPKELYLMLDWPPGTARRVQELHG